MDIKEESRGGATVVEVSGRIDSATAPALQERLSAIMSAAKVNVLLDLGRLDYISSAGFRVLLLAGKRSDENGTRFVLCSVSGKVRQLFDLGGFLDLFTIAATREEGRAAVGWIA